ncbi:homoserine kinase type II [Rhizomicrobium palustre]|uniref:Homoserine kinase n=1 Tax=Rhizomicrobium palustre TaxID=189966 RepID=A0A846N0F9_9PROT|nr:homoserine kinase [Rhizomicrobium palustre]NIK89368.1 homoserine kinase type II [Rhizomicrobium palustre]
MAVYTDVSFEELESFLAGYDIGAPLTFKGIAEGVENSNYFLQTTKGGFILTLYEKRVKVEDLPFFLGLLEHLSANGIACPLPVRSLEGAQSSRLSGRTAALFTFLNGLSLRKPDGAHCAAAGAALAKLHEAGKGFALKRKNALSYDGWRELVEACLPRADEVEQGLGELIRTAHDEITANWPVGLPQGVIHADLFPDNVLFMNGQVSGLIDFYFACNDAYAYDLAVMLNAWCFEPDVAFNVTKSKSLIAAYCKGRELTKEEREALPILARGAALRFLLTRLYDWLNHDPNALVRPKDPREYSRRLRFHKKVRSSSEYGL